MRPPALFFSLDRELASPKDFLSEHNYKNLVMRILQIRSNDFDFVQCVLKNRNLMLKPKIC